MARGGKASFSNRERRQADHAEETSKSRRLPARRDEKLARATTDKQSGGSHETGETKGRRTGSMLGGKTRSKRPGPRTGRKSGR